MSLVACLICIFIRYVFSMLCMLYTKKILMCFYSHLNSDIIAHDISECDYWSICMTPRMSLIAGLICICVNLFFELFGYDSESTIS